MGSVKQHRHIAIYLPSVRGGGAERVMVTLANGFAARGHRVDLVLAKAEGPYLVDVAPAVRVVGLNKGRVLASLMPLARYLRKERPDAMLSAMSHANIIAILACKLARAKIRLAVSERSVPSRNLDCRGMAVIRWLIPRLYPLADVVICVSKGIQEEMEQLLGLSPEKLLTIYNPLDLDRIARLKIAEADHRWFEPNKPPVILAVGRLTAAKDYPTLLRAFAKLRQSREARLIVLGEGEERVSLEQLVLELGIRQDVDFPGFKENPFAWMAACDLYVMSSAWEGLPGALLEAIACGARVVSTDCRTGPNEILERGRWGRLVPVGDAQSLAEAMAEALDDPYLLDTKQRAGDFHFERIILQYEAELKP